MNLPDNFEKCEAEYYKNFDPYSEIGKECEYCEDYFETNDERNVYCSKKCYTAAKADWDGDT